MVQNEVGKACMRFLQRDSKKVFWRKYMHSRLIAGATIPQRNAVVRGGTVTCANGHMILGIGALLGLMMLTTSLVSAQQRVTLSVGRLSYSGIYVQQNVSVKNDNSFLIRLVQIECGFLSKGELIATDHTYLENIAPNTTGFRTVVAMSGIDPDRAECRIVSAQ